MKQKYWYIKNYFWIHNIYNFRAKKIITPYRFVFTNTSMLLIGWLHNTSRIFIKQQLFLRAVAIFFFNLWLFLIICYFFYFLKSCESFRNLFLIFLLVFIIYPFWASFVFFFKNFFISKNLNSLTRFWKRNFLLFWGLEFFLFFIFFILMLRDFGVVYYMYTLTNIVDFIVYWDFFFFFMVFFNNYFNCLLFKFKCKNNYSF